VEEEEDNFKNMALYRAIKKNFGIICFWIASVIFTYSIGRTDINSIQAKTQAAHEVFKDSPLLQFDSLGNQVHPGVVKLDDGSLYYYNHTTPLIFIGGMPRSGTTLMRVMMDAHEDVRCGEETRLVPRLLGMRANWYRSAKEKVRLKEAGVTEDVVDEAMRQFIMEVIVRHGTPAKYLCNKDPFTLKSLVYLKKLFPNSKFILMIRDGRATAHSIIERKVTISGFDITSYRDVLTKWNRAIDGMYTQCLESSSFCKPVWYEQLVLHPEATIKEITDFLGIDFSMSMLEHEQHISDIKISKVEKSTSQVQKPVYLDALSAWWGHIPQDVENDLEKIAPMLGKLGYDYHPKEKPTYGTADQMVLDKIERFKKEFSREWEQEGMRKEGVEEKDKGFDAT